MAEALPCAHCGAVLPLSSLLRIDTEGAYQYRCQECAIALPASEASAPKHGG